MKVKSYVYTKIDNINHEKVSIKIVNRGKVPSNHFI